MTLSATDLVHLTRAVDLAERALEAGDQPFGSLLVDASGNVLREAVQRISTGDATQHPEFELARWSATALTPEQRATTTMYTSGEHCPMCAAAHGWVELGRLVYAASSAQLEGWLAEWGLPEPPVRCLPVEQVVPGIDVDGPAPELTGRLRALHARCYGVTLPESDTPSGDTAD